jgi:hypothetical protein
MAVHLARFSIWGLKQDGTRKAVYFDGIPSALKFCVEGRGDFEKLTQFVRICKNMLLLLVLACGPSLV